jgi:UDP-4-amino-4,6-dideoxy-N-acetyl-beta-L-altrosamine N-acetyltransferase
MHNEIKENFELEGLSLINFIYLSDQEIEFVRIMRNNEDIRKNSFNNEIIEIKDHQDFIEHLRKDRNCCYWLVKDKSFSYIGVISLLKIDFKNANAYLGIYANPYEKQKGMGSCLLKALFHVAFTVAHFHTLKLEVIEDNSKAIRFYRKSGFQEEGRLKEYLYRDSIWKDIIIMGIINNDRFHL